MNDDGIELILARAPHFGDILPGDFLYSPEAVDNADNDRFKWALEPEKTGHGTFYRICTRTLGPEQKHFKDGQMCLRHEGAAPTKLKLVEYGAELKGRDFFLWNFKLQPGGYLPEGQSVGGTETPAATSNSTEAAGEEASEEAAGLLEMGVKHKKAGLKYTEEEDRKIRENALAVKMALYFIEVAGQPDVYLNQKGEGGSASYETQYFASPQYDMRQYFIGRCVECCKAGDCPVVGPTTTTPKPEPFMKKHGELVVGGILLLTIAIGFFLIKRKEDVLLSLIISKVRELIYFMVL